MIWKQFAHLGNFPPELKTRFNSFLTTEFDDSLSVEMQLRSIIKWCQENFNAVETLIDFINELSNWLKQFENNFDTKLEESVITVLSEWQASGQLDVVISEALQWELDEFKATTEQNFISLKHDINETINTNTINISNDIGSGVRPVFKRLVSDMKQNIKESVFNLGIITDTHCSEMTGVPHFSTQVHSLNHITNFHSALGEADCLIYGGDNVACENPDIRVNNQMLNTFTSKVFDTKMKADRFILKGNHDTYLPSTIVNETQLQTNTKIRPSQLMSDTDTNGYYRSDVKLFNEVRNGDSLYFFKDYADKKIRLIGLNTNDNPSNVDSNGYIKYFDMSYLGLRQGQLNWLANVALQNIPHGYDVVIVSHCPLTDPHLTNGNIALGIIKAFQKGNNYSGVGTIVDWQVNVTASFSHNLSHKVVGCFSGHWHREQFNGLDDEIHVISLNASWYSGQSERSLANSNSTNNEDCWYLIGVDTTNKTVKIYGFDYGNDYQYSY